MYKIALGIKVKENPWGGGNQFGAAFVEYFNSFGIVVTSTLDEDSDLIMLMDPRRNVESFTFTHKEIFKFKKKHRNVKVVHRINECDLRKGTRGMDKKLIKANKCADYTVFISEWLRDYFFKQGFNKERPHTVIRNGADEHIYFSEGKEMWDGKSPMRLVTHHWSDNWMKGFDIYSKLDRFLADPWMRSLFSFTFIGRWPANLEFKNTRTVGPLYRDSLAKELRNHHVYLTASRWEPCGMHHIEGALCGLPVLYINEGGGIEECCKDIGLKFNVEDFALSLFKMREEYYNLFSKLKNYNLTSRNCLSHYHNIFNELMGR